MPDLAPSPPLTIEGSARSWLETKLPALPLLATTRCVERSPRRMRSTRSRLSATLQAYARMAGNYEAENRCAEMRLRAERRAGELLAAMDKAKGGQPYQATGPAARPVETCANLGITKNQSSTWQRLAAVPQERFEMLLTRETTRLPPTARGIR